MHEIVCNVSGRKRDDDEQQQGDAKGWDACACGELFRRPTRVQSVGFSLAPEIVRARYTDYVSRMSSSSSSWKVFTFRTAIIVQRHHAPAVRDWLMMRKKKQSVTVSGGLFRSTAMIKSPNPVPILWLLLTIKTVRWRERSEANDNRESISRQIKSTYLEFKNCTPSNVEYFALLLVAADRSPLAIRAAGHRVTFGTLLRYLSLVRRILQPFSFLFIRTATQWSIDDDLLKVVERFSNFFNAAHRHSGAYILGARCLFDIYILIYTGRLYLVYCNY